MVGRGLYLSNSLKNIATRKGDTMKKFVFVSIVFAILLAGCSTPTPLPEPTAKPILTLPPTKEPTATIEPTSTPIPEPTVDVNSLDYIVEQWLIEPEVVFKENVDDMASNEGGQFGGATQKFADSTLFVFSNGSEGIWTPLNTKLDEYGGMEKGGNQAILFKFQSEQPETLFFTFMGDQREINVDFWEGGKPRFNLVNDFESTPYTGVLALVPNNAYFMLMAMDSEGNFRSIVWEEAEPRNRSTFSGAFGERAQEYKNSSWKFILGSNAPTFLSLEEYRVYKFNGFAQ